jgi:hypothetical protein
VPGVCPHLVDRHYKSAKRRHSFEDISQSPGNVVCDNAPDIARDECARVRACVRGRAATHTLLCAASMPIGCRYGSENREVVDERDLDNISRASVSAPTRGNKMSLHKSAIVLMTRAMP